ncbi:hypothetical protein OGA_04741 [Enterococcus faecium EnGen0012]|uniref:DUF4352 domain-containing protein n=1 Tax=Enterococcus faecium TaxID=1352 RepID=UPI0002A3FB80|nr:DUF4352 domain-containing protein [Enterococcus faecium]EGP5707750.1 DUF4352 domain-containing protein [Enterococcus faecium]ELA51844.1 hypothetical protein OGA_04741 [Enterococcus faecium EnGen0012]ELA90641.1 hypothetical protein OI7_04537 [Enterococcus faecium EnGen0020]HAZ4707630.1 DUF4352 domain-containing protein [Enterococcus faecium]
MAKKVMGQDGKMYKVSKPFYKKVWFWVLAVILIIIIGSALNGGSDSNKASDNGGEKVTKSSTSASSSKEEKSDTFYKIGDTVKVGDAEYTLNSVELTDERNQFEENQPAQVVKITYTVKNDGDSDIPVGTDVEVYGPDDKKSETYANENTMGSVAPGKQMDVTAHFTLNQTGEIEIHFSPLVSFEKAAIFKATV